MIYYLGSLSASYVVDYSSKLGIPPMVFLGALIGVDTIICFFLKETLGVPREEQITELKSRPNSLTTDDIAKI